MSGLNPEKEINDAFRVAVQGMTPGQVEELFTPKPDAPTVESLATAAQEEGASMLYPGKIVQRAVEIRQSEEAA